VEVWKVDLQEAEAELGAGALVATLEEEAVEEDLTVVE